MARTNLEVFRIRKHMTHEEISKEIGCNRATYSAIEGGKRDGRQAFWKKLQAAFDIPEAEMWELMKNDEA